MVYFGNEDQSRISHQEILSSATADWRKNVAKKQSRPCRDNLKIPNLDFKVCYLKNLHFALYFYCEKCGLYRWLPTRLIRSAPVFAYGITVTNNAAVVRIALDHPLCSVSNISQMAKMDALICIFNI